MTQDTIRILRVIEYTGPRDKVKDQVSRSLHGAKFLPSGVTIRAATVGTYPEIIDDIPTTICPDCGHLEHTTPCTYTFGPGSVAEGEQCDCQRVSNWQFAHLEGTGNRKKLPDEEPQG